jgi:hypothetical protein
MRFPLPVASGFRGRRWSGEVDGVLDEFIEEPDPGTEELAHLRLVNAKPLGERAAFEGHREAFCERGEDGSVDASTPPIGRSAWTIATAGRRALAACPLASGRHLVNEFRGATAVVGAGATEYFKRGTSELTSAQLVLQAILRACDDAGVDPRAVDGFVSYGGDSCEGLAIGAALGVREVRWSTQVWGGGGGGVAAAVNCAAAAVYSGQADCVAVYRGLSEATDGRRAFNKAHMGHLYAAHGMLAPAQVCAMRTQRMLEVDNVPASALEAVSLVGYLSPCPAQSTCRRLWPAAWPRAVCEKQIDLRSAAAI